MQWMSLCGKSYAYALEKLRAGTCTLVLFALSGIALPVEGPVVVTMPLRHMLNLYMGGLLLKEDIGYYLNCCSMVWVIWGFMILPLGRG
jgi:hypothetical protein